MTFEFTFLYIRITFTLKFFFDHLNVSYTFL
nr:MAG TPA: hypothetical protein [Caudoviricetes sp.]